MVIAASCCRKDFDSLTKLLIAGATVMHDDLPVVSLTSKCCTLLLLLLMMLLLMMVMMVMVMLLTEVEGCYTAERASWSSSQQHESDVRRCRLGH